MYDMDAPGTSDLFQIACGLRDEDYNECLASGFVDPLGALLWSVEMSDESLTVLLDGEPVGVWGFSDEGDGSCVVWAVGTDRMIDKPIALYKASISMRDMLLQRFDTIRNTVYSHNKGHIEWLKRLGAKFSETDDPYFLEFEITKP